VPSHRYFLFLLIFTASLAAVAVASAQDVEETAPEETAADADDDPDASGSEADNRATRIEAEARTLFEAGRMAFADGRFEDALNSFERAHQLADRPILLFNIGTSFDRLQRKREAIEAFEGYLEHVPDAHNRGEVESRLISLRDAVAAEDARAEEHRLEEERRRAVEAELAARDAEPAFYETWWFWTIIGALAVGGIVAAGVLAYDPGQEDPFVGSTGQVTFTLEGP
jgi:tetratricopeptide (TPR) repeat protein